MVRIVEIQMEKTIADGSKQGLIGMICRGLFS